MEERKVRAFTAEGVNFSLSNYMPGCNKGFDAAREEFKRVVNSQPTDAKAICDVLKAHKWTCGTNFEPCEKIDGDISILATDCFDNESVIRITESREEE